MFAIDPITGGILTLVELDREEVDYYPLTLSARDSGSPSTHTNVSVMVTVGDVNDNDPYFISGAVVMNESVQIYEVCCAILFVVMLVNHSFSRILPQTRSSQLFKPWMLT